MVLEGVIMFLANIIHFTTADWFRCAQIIQNRQLEIIPGIFLTGTGEKRMNFSQVVGELGKEVCQCGASVFSITWYQSLQCDRIHREKEG